MKTKAKTVSPCAAYSDPEGVEGTGQKQPPMVFIGYSAKADQLIALRTQTLLAVHGISCSVPTLPDRHNLAPLGTEIIIRFERTKTTMHYGPRSAKIIADAVRSLIAAQLKLRAAVQSPRTAKRTKKGVQGGQK